MSSFNKKCSTLLGQNELNTGEMHKASQTIHEIVEQNPRGRILFKFDFRTGIKYGALFMCLLLN